MIPELRERMISELLRRPNHIINAESFMVESKGVLESFPDLRVMIFDLTTINLADSARNVKFAKNNGLVKMYKAHLEYDYQIEAESANITTVKVEARGVSLYRLGSLKDRLDFIAGGLSGKAISDPHLFHLGVHIDIWRYNFK